MHRIDGGEVLEAFAGATKISTNLRLIHSLRDLGQAHARAWLEAHYSSVGVKCTVNIKRDYLDDMRVPV
jgi:NTE family protein